jgi:hypothetical protein
VALCNVSVSVSACRIAERLKRVFWLNPKGRMAWGWGDSEMPLFDLLHRGPRMRHRAANARWRISWRAISRRTGFSAIGLWRRLSGIQP